MWLGINQNLATIKGDPSLHLTETKALVVLVGCEKKGVNINGSIGTKMQSVARLINRMRAVLVELLVILLFDIVFRLQPNRLDGIHTFSVQTQREGHKTGMFVDNSFQSVLFREVFFIFFQVNHDTSPTFLVLSFRDRITALTITFPLQTFGRLIPRMSVDLNLFGRHKGRIKPDSKLPDNRSISIALFLKSFQKFFGTRTSNRSKIISQLIARHSDPMISDRNSSGFLIGSDVDFKRQIPLINPFLSQFLEAELF